MKRRRHVYSRHHVFSRAGNEVKRLVGTHVASFAGIIIVNNYVIVLVQVLRTSCSKLHIFKMFNNSVNINVYKI